MPTRPPASPIRRPARFLLTARHNRRPTLLPPRHTSTACWRTALRHSDVLTMTSWMGLTRSRTVDCLPRQRFPSQEVVLGGVGVAHALRDALNASGPCEVSSLARRPSPNLTPDRMRRDPGSVGGYSSL